MGFFFFGWRPENIHSVCCDYAVYSSPNKYASQIFPFLSNGWNIIVPNAFVPTGHVELALSWDMWASAACLSTFYCHLEDICLFKGSHCHHYLYLSQPAKLDLIDSLLQHKHLALFFIQVFLVCLLVIGQPFMNKKCFHLLCPEALFLNAYPSFLSLCPKKEKEKTQSSSNTRLFFFLREIKCLQIWGSQMGFYGHNWVWFPLSGFPHSPASPGGPPTLLKQLSVAHRTDQARQKTQRCRSSVCKETLYVCAALTFQGHCTGLTRFN